MLVVVLEISASHCSLVECCSLDCAWLGLFLCQLWHTQSSTFYILLILQHYGAYVCWHMWNTLSTMHMVLLYLRINRETILSNKLVTKEFCFTRSLNLPMWYSTFCISLKYQFLDSVHLLLCKANPCLIENRCSLIIVKLYAIYARSTQTKPFNMKLLINM